MFITKTGVNWANDYPRSSTLSSQFLEDPAFRAQQTCEARLRTLQFLYYVQHELNRPDWSIADDEGYAAHFDGAGCPNIPAAFKSVEQHFPPIPYMRESRRIVGKYTLTGKDLIGRDTGGTPKLFDTSLAIAGYGDDLHNCNTAPTLDDGETPADVTGYGAFQIPFEVFIPETVEGLVAAEKNLSQTRLANGATRLQPSTMMTGQAAGAIAAIAVKKNVPASQVPVIAVQDALVKARSPLSYFTYSDVDGGDPLWGDVQIASTRGVLRGYGTGVFGRDDPLTRAQSAVVLCKLLGLSTSGAPAMSPFGDVLATDPAYPSIWAVYNANLTAGCQASPLMFCPTASVTRQQLATFLAKGLNLPASSHAQYFTDEPSTLATYPYVQSIAEAGLMGACAMGPQDFCPTQAVTRGEAATVSRATLLYGQ
jgi:hypothetical protein